MKYTVLDHEQRSPEWYLARAGRLTGSVAADMATKIKSGAWSASRKNLRMRLALERLTGRPQESNFVSVAMQRGIDLESSAFGRYEAESGYILERPGFLQADTIMVGCSLDALVHGGKGIVEAKCPESATHYEYLRTHEIPADYRWQCVHNLWVSGAGWCDFISFDDRFPEDLQYLCIRLERDQSEIEAYEKMAYKFLDEVDAEVVEINRLRAA